VSDRLHFPPTLRTEGNEACVRGKRGIDSTVLRVSRCGHSNLGDLRLRGRSAPCLAFIQRWLAKHPGPLLLARVDQTSLVAAQGRSGVDLSHAMRGPNSRAEQLRS